MKCPSTRLGWSARASIPKRSGATSMRWRPPCVRSSTGSTCSRTNWPTPGTGRPIPSSTSRPSPRPWGRRWPRSSTAPTRPRPKLWRGRKKRPTGCSRLPTTLWPNNRRPWSNARPPSMNVRPHSTPWWQNGWPRPKRPSPWRRGLWRKNWPTGGPLSRPNSRRFPPKQRRRPPVDCRRPTTRPPASCSGPRKSAGRWWKRPNGPGSRC